MTKRCLCPAALCFLLGIVLSVKGRPWVIIPAVLLIFYAALRFYTYQMTVKGLCFSAVLAATFFFGILTGNHNNILRDRYLNVLADGQDITVQGRLYKKEVKSDRIYLYLDRGQVLIDGTPVPCRDIMVEADSTEYISGNTLVVKGTYASFGKARNEGNYDEEDYNFGRGVDIKVSGRVQIEEYGKKATFREKLYKIKTKMKAVMLASLPGSGGGTLSAMVLGDKTSLTPEDKTLFSEAGLSHILSVSGLHVSLLCLGLFKLLRKAHLSVLPASAASSLFAITYCLFTGENTATVRAVGMFLLSMLAMVTGEAYDILTALSMLAIIVAAKNPSVIFTAGFLLSFGAVLGIAVTGREFTAFYMLLVKRRNTVRNIKRRIDEAEKKAVRGEPGIWEKIGQRLFGHLRVFAEGLFGVILVNIGIIITTLPLIAWFYYEIPTLSLAINLVVVPLMGALLCIGFLGSLFGCGIFAVGTVMLFPCGVILDFYRKVAELSGRVPFSTWIVGRPSLTGVVVFYILLFVFLLALCKVRNKMSSDDMGEKYIVGKERMNLPLYGVGIILLTLLLAIILRGFVPHVPQVVMLDVDQGDGIYIKTDSGDAIFIDGGSTGIKSCGKYRILPFLKVRGESHIDYWIVSHADEDHVSGICEILEEDYRVRNLLVSDEIYEDENTKNLFCLAYEKKINVIRMNPGDLLMSGKDRFTCLFPYEGYMAEDANTASLVVLYETESFDMLFTGDMGQKEEKELMKRWDRSDDKPLLLKVAHHGSKNSSNRDFLEVLSPKAAFISVGVKHPYGHPHKETIDKLKEIGTQIYRTDRDGEIIVEGKKDDIKIRSLL